MLILKQLQLQSQVNNIIQFHLTVCFAISHVVIPMKRSQIIKLIGGEENVNCKSLEKLSQGLCTTCLTVIRG